MQWESVTCALVIFAFAIIFRLTLNLLISFEHIILAGTTVAVTYLAASAGSFLT